MIIEVDEAVRVQCHARRPASARTFASLRSSSHSPLVRMLASPEAGWAASDVSSG